MSAVFPEPFRPEVSLRIVIVFMMNLIAKD